MKRSLFAFVALALASCLAACWRFLADPIGVVHRAYQEVKDFAAKFAISALKLAGKTPDDRMPAIVALVQAKAFVIRLAKRERPTITSTWRMCPST